MIILVHDFKKVTSILDEALKPINEFVVGDSITHTLKTVVLKRTDELVIWCHQSLVEYLNLQEFSKIFHHKRIFASFNPTNTNYLPEQIGYVERSFFIKINKKVTYPTWVTSSCIGGIYTNVINELKLDLSSNNSFDYFLVSLAKQTMINGLFCYSDPRLINNTKEIKLETPKASKQELFKFVKQQYKWV